MHLDPTEGKARNVAQPFLEMLFPPEENPHVPIIAVTGTNGKTTTAKLIAHTRKYQGNRVGLAGTTGVEIDGIPVVTGDYGGPEGAGMVLREPTVDLAVLEVARGGIIRRGLGFEECDVGIILNVEDDHIGNDGVEDLEELALVKCTVIEVVKNGGVSVLNADDPTVVSLKERAGGQVIYFSLEEDNPVVREHLNAGGTAVVIEGADVVIRSAEPPVQVLPIVEAPVTLRGVATFNTANVLAAVAALHGLSTPVNMIRTGVSTFHPSATQNPGRMNVIDFVNFKVIVDYGHNVPAITALGRALPLITKGRKIVVAHGTGNRPDAGIRAFGAALASVYDHIILVDVDPRHRAPEETPHLVRSGAIDAGFPHDRAEVIIDPLEAIDRAFGIVRPGDLIVVQVDEVEPMLNRVMTHFERLVGSRSPVDE
jgi:cyanophycin synthetase